MAKEPTPVSQPQHARPAPPTRPGEAPESAQSRAATTESTLRTGSNVNTTLPPRQKTEEELENESRMSFDKVMALDERLPSAQRIIGDVRPNITRHPMGTIHREVDNCSTVRGSVQCLLTGIALRILQYRGNPDELEKIAAGLLDGQVKLSEAVISKSSLREEEAEPPTDVDEAMVGRLVKTGD